MVNMRADFQQRDALQLYVRERNWTEGMSGGAVWFEGMRKRPYRFYKRGETSVSLSLWD